MTHDDETVERVANAIEAIIGPPFGTPEYLAKHGDRIRARNRDTARTFARAALSAMPPPELRIGAFVLRPSPNGIWIGRDGEGGEFATEHVERVIAQYYREQF